MASPQLADVGQAVSPILSGVEVIREGRVEPYLHVRPTLSSSSVRWAGLAVEDYSVPACVIERHEHLLNFLHVVLQGSVEYEVFKELGSDFRIRRVRVPGQVKVERDPRE